MADLNLTELRQTAAAATPGRWRVTHDPLGTHVETDDDRMGRVVLGSSIDRGPEYVEADAEHIATFDPPTVLALIDRVEAAEREWARHVCDRDALADKVARAEALAEACETVSAAARAEADMHPLGSTEWCDWNEAANDEAANARMVRDALAGESDE